MDSMLFKGVMVRAILAGTKTQTRRLVKITHRTPGLAACLLPPVGHPRPKLAAELSPHRPGDLLWVREACRAEELPDGLDGVRYLADNGWRAIEDTKTAAEDWVKLNHYRGQIGANVPSIHMPQWASRISLRVKDVRVERLNDISETDALAEGITTLRTPEWDNLHFQAWRSKYAWAVANGLKPPIGPSPSTAYRALWEEINGPGSWDLNPWVWVYEFKWVTP